MMSSREYYAKINGLQIIKTPENDKYALEFGQFAGDKDYTDETIIIDWNDGSKDTLSFSSSFKWKKKEPQISTTFFLNGKKIEERFYIITK